MIRLCALCMYPTKRNLPFCLRCYKEHKEVIVEAINLESQWLYFIEADVAREQRRLEKEREMYSYDDW
jgi:hypothetical protein